MGDQGFACSGLSPAFSGLLVQQLTLFNASGGDPTSRDLWCVPSPILHFRFLAAHIITHLVSLRASVSFPDLFLTSDSRTNEIIDHIVISKTQKRSSECTSCNFQNIVSLFAGFFSTGFVRHSLAVLDDALRRGSFGSSQHETPRHVRILTPSLFVPSHTSYDHQHPTCSPLFELYDNAVRLVFILFHQNGELIFLFSYGPLLAAVPHLLSK